jgi:hypothetical protein
LEVLGFRSLERGIAQRVSDLAPGWMRSSGGATQALSCPPEGFMAGSSDMVSDLILNT